jgi:hypothetical protein
VSTRCLSLLCLLAASLCCVYSLPLAVCLLAASLCCVYSLPLSVVSTHCLSLCVYSLPLSLSVSTLSLSLCVDSLSLSLSVCSLCFSLCVFVLFLCAALCPLRLYVLHEYTPPLCVSPVPVCVFSLVRTLCLSVWPQMCLRWTPCLCACVYSLYSVCPCLLRVCHQISVRLSFLVVYLYLCPYTLVLNLDCTPPGRVPVSVCLPVPSFISVPVSRYSPVPRLCIL